MTKQEADLQLRSVDGAEPERRKLALALLGALGGAALFDACSGGGAEEGVAADPPAEFEQTSQGLIGTSAIKWVDAIFGTSSNQGLKQLTGQGTTAATTSTVIALGRNARGDGGGGVFMWIATATPPPEDGGVVFRADAPSPAGYWKRLYAHGAVDVRWFGALGDGAADDGPAIQKAINFASGNVGPPSTVPLTSRGVDVLFPPGIYKVNAPSSDAALWIGSNNVSLVGVGGPPNGSQILVNGPGSGILIETGGATVGDAGTCGSSGLPFPSSAVARGTTIRNLSIYGVNHAQDGIVVHAASVNIVDCYVTSMSRHGILIESGCGTAGGLYGVSRAFGASGGPYYFNVNMWRVTNVSFELCGNPAGNGDEMQGAALFVHGYDSNAGVATALHAQNCNVAYFDGAAGGATWVGCYAEANLVGYKNGSVQSSVYVNCWSEDVKHGVFTGAAAIAVGGSLATAGAQGAGQRIGYEASQLRFGAMQGDGAKYGANIPGHPVYKGAIDITRGYLPRSNDTNYAVGDRVVPQPANGHFYKCTTAGKSAESPPAFPSGTGATVADGTTLVWTEEGTTAGNSQWTFGYEPYPNPPSQYPYQQKSWRWFHLLNGIIDCNYTDCYNGPFGWTSFDNARGGGLPMIGNPLMNTLRRWTWRQSKDLQNVPIVLQPGPNVIYLAGISGGTLPQPSGAATFGDNPNSIWPNAETRVSVEVEFADVTALTGADLRIVGYTFIPIGTGSQRNIAVKLVNGGASAVTVTLVWHFETFVANFPGGLA